MALRRVVAAIDVVVNGERNVDRLAQTYRFAEQTAANAARQVQTFSFNTQAAALASDAASLTSKDSPSRASSVRFDDRDSVVTGLLRTCDTRCSHESHAAMLIATLRIDAFP